MKGYSYCRPRWNTSCSVSLDTSRILKKHTHAKYFATVQSFSNVVSAHIIAAKRPNSALWSFRHTLALSTQLLAVSHPILDLYGGKPTAVARGWGPHHGLSCSLHVPRPSTQETGSTGQVLSPVALVGICEMSSETKGFPITGPFLWKVLNNAAHMRPFWGV